MPSLPTLQSTLQRLPARRRPALALETWSSVGTGAYAITVFPIALVVLQTVLDADLWYQALIAVMFLGSSLLSPLVTYIGRSVSMKKLVVWPNMLVAVLLVATLIPSSTPLLFTLIVGVSFFIRVFPRVAEMNMFRILYPATHRGTAIGWTRAVSALSGVGLTVIAWKWLDTFPHWYAAVFLLVGALMVMSAWFYNRIPINRHTMFARDNVDTSESSPMESFRLGARAFLDDRRFLKYQAVFAIAGLANHIAIMLIPMVLEEDVQAQKTTVRFVAAVLPNLMMVLTAPMWGRFLDSRNPMISRAIFNSIQCAAFVCYAVGGLTLQTWLFVLGTVLHATSNGGGVINWLTGSMYFAKPERVSLYNGIHVFLTGVRGFIGPTLGYFLFIDQETIAGTTIRGLGLGSHVFTIAAGLSLLGGVLMFRMHKADTGSREQITA